MRQLIVPQRENGRQYVRLDQKRTFGTSSMKYADAGVDIAVADAAKQRIRHHASRTFTPGVLGGIGGFGGLFRLPPS